MSSILRIIARRSIEQKDLQNYIYTTFKISDSRIILHRFTSSKETRYHYFYACQCPFLRTALIAPERERRDRLWRRQRAGSVMNGLNTAWRHRMDYINGGARDIGRRKEVRFLSYLQGIPFVRARITSRINVCMYVYVCMCARGRFVVEGSFIRKRTSSVRILMTTMPPLDIVAGSWYARHRTQCKIIIFTNHNNFYVLIVVFFFWLQVVRVTCARRSLLAVSNADTR